MRSSSSKWIFLSGITLIMLTICISFFNHLNEASPIAKNGVLDLTNWRVDEKEVIKLDGEWEFYWQQLLNPVEAKERSSVPGSDAVIVPVPGEWVNYSSKGESFPVIGYATYRLRILLPSNESTQWAIKTTHIRISHDMYINGEFVGSSGTPGMTKKTSVNGNVPYSTVFSSNERTLDLVIRVSNFEGFSSGISHSIYFGTPNGIKDFEQFRIAVAVSLFSGLFIIGLYFLGLFFQRRSMVELSDFSMFCMSASAFSFIYFERLLLRVIPDIDIILNLYVQIVCGLLTVVFLTRYLTRILPMVYSQRWSNWMTRYLVVLIVVLPFIPADYYYSTTVILAFTLFGMMTYHLVQLVRTFYLKIQSSEYIALGMISIFLVMVITITNVFFPTDPYYFFPIGLMIFVISQALFMSQNYTEKYETITSLLDRLKQLDGVKDEFLAKTSHELKTPLNGMINLSQSLLDGSGGPLTKAQSEDIILMRDLGTRLTTLVNDLLDYSKMKHGDLLLSVRVIDVHAVIAAVVDLFRFSIKNKSLTIHLLIAPGTFWIMADENRFYQIVYNLVDNALKYTNQGSITISARHEHSFVWVTIADTGVGIPPELHEKIFESFEQVEPALTRSQGGVGLGLAITKQLVELQGGTITVESEPGKGTSMSFAIPQGLQKDSSDVAIAQVSIPTNSLLLPTPLEEKAHLEGARILVVDDEYSNRKALNNILSLHGYQVVEAQAGEDALTVLEGDARFELIILDIMMPGMSGYEVCRNIRERRSAIDLPILMLSAKSLPGDLDAGFQAGANDFLEKPFHRTELLARVQTLIRMKEAIDERLKVEMDMLQMQIQPHFIFNCISTMISYCYTDPEKAGQLLHHFSQYLRHFINLMEHQSVTTVADELNHIECYVSLDEARFDKDFLVEMEVDETALFCEIPALLIQPLVENALQHAFVGDETDGKVVVSIKIVDDGLRITVKDNGVGIDESIVRQLHQFTDFGESVGLLNVHRRLLNLTGRGLEIESGPGQGTVVSFFFQKN